MRDKPRPSRDPRNEQEHPGSNFLRSTDDDPVSRVWIFYPALAVGLGTAACVVAERLPAGPETTRVGGWILALVAGACLGVLAAAGSYLLLGILYAFASSLFGWRQMHYVHFFARFLDWLSLPAWW